MKVQCDRESLAAAFQIASAVAPARSPKEILKSVKLQVQEDQAILMATDLEIGIRVQVQGVEIEQPGSAILPTDRLGTILREATDAKLYLEAQSGGTQVKGERSEFNFPGENPDEFPEVATFEEENFHKIPGRLLHELIARTVFATDNESTRYALGGLLFELTEDKAITVGTDGRRLAKMEGPAESVGGHNTADRMTIVPTKAMQLIARHIGHGDEEVQVAARANDILFRSDQITLYSRLVEGRFPKWRDVFPSSEGAQNIELVVGPVHSAVRQAAIVTSDESRGIDFTFSDGNFTLSGRTADKGQSRVQLPISYAGPEVTITLDPRYMSDFLRVLDDEKTFTVSVRNANSAAVCRTDDGYDYVIMPLSRDSA